MPDAALMQKRIAVVRGYFLKIDRVDPTVLDLMTDDVETYFPKFGVGYGKAEFMRIAEGLMGSLKSIRHELEQLRVHVADNHVIAEGIESGVMADGRAWPVPGLSEGRFANVFEFKGDLIKRIYIYVDPDFSSDDKERFLWGDKVRIAKT